MSRKTLIVPDKLCALTPSASMLASTVPRFKADRKATVIISATVDCRTAWVSPQMKGLSNGKAESAQFVQQRAPKAW